MTRRAVILFGHGSRDPAWREPMDRVAARLELRGPVRCAFLELQRPTLADAAAELAGAADEVVIVPMFLGAGHHVREDLPRVVADLRAKWPAVRFDLKPPVGEDALLLDRIAALALE